MNAEDIFLAAIEIAAGSARAAFLTQTCGRDSELRAEVESLLTAHETSDDLLDAPLVNLSASTLPEAAVAPLPRLAPGSMLGRYRIVRWIGAGGMGEVHLAHDQQLQREVAIKVLFLSHARDQQWLSRFHREARAAGAVNHPGILTIHEIGSAEGIDFIASEFVYGQTLRQVMQSGTLPLPRAVDLGRQIAGAIAAAHSAGVVHRDIKPENVMVRDDDLIKVLDFGLARSPEVASLERATASGLSNVSFQGLIAGTLTYMSPEQARGQRVDHRSDVFSLGVLLCELLTGQHPFPGPTPGDVLVAILDRAPQIARRPDGLLPDSLHNMLARMLIRDQSQRTITAGEAATVLRSSLSAVATQQISVTASVQPSALRSESPPSSDTLSSRSPEIRYTTSSDVSIAYQVFGSGPIDLVFVMGWVSHLEWFWKEPNFAKFLRDIGRFARVILFDKRGTGLSDRVPVQHLPTLEQRMDDVRAVMDAAESQSAVLCGVSEGGPMCALFAATYPERTLALTMIGSYARRLWAEDYPFGVREEYRSHFLDEIRRNWGGPVGIEDRAPSLAHDPAFREWWATYLRMGASPGAALALTEMNARIDIRPILPLVRVPTLVIHRRADRCLKVEEGRYLADHIPGARFCELGGDDHLPFAGNQSEITEAISAFLQSVPPRPIVNRVLATVLAGRFEDASAEQSNSSVARFQSAIADEVTLFRGSRPVFVGTRFLATFDGPTRAIRAALGLVQAAHRIGLDFHAGVHIGECDIADNSISGTAARLAQQLADVAENRHVIVTDTIRNLTAGSGLQFQPLPAVSELAIAESLNTFRVVQ